MTGAHQIEDMLQACTWLSYDTCTARDFTTTMTDFGACKQFCTPSSEACHLKRRLSWLVMTSVRKVERMRKWSLKHFSLSFLQVLIHPPNELPLVRRNGFSVAPGFETEISIKKMKTQHLPLPYEPGCEDRNLRYSGVYTSDLCRYECEVDKLIEICGCKDITYPGML
ncbi:Acid-sensing ion channel 1 [Holothuria leucospilota]|uniref:Acid-sensing ion channel 1 n=1 Tax=Holothuria leucospilota TaxID=206669 RepID=A0A9Q1BKM3_HOLLE|nr:Acid-sensing ion channel 1 [Holothuria leucospilota]